MRSVADEKAERHVMLCAVILGKVEKVDAGSQQRYPSSPEFDSGADDPQNPKWYAVWPTNVCSHILPECVVSYNCSPGTVICLCFLTRKYHRFFSICSTLVFCLLYSKRDSEHKVHISSVVYEDQDVTFPV